MAEAILALESGLVLRGEAFGAPGESTGEVVFNTAMTGYQEIITDPSYRGQMVCMTYPLIGNYGINDEDVESRKVFLSGFIVKELSRVVSNWRASKSLGQYLEEQGVTGIQGIDTRALTVHLRERGAMRAVLSTEDLNPESLLKKARAARGTSGIDLVKEVAEIESYPWEGSGRYHVVAVDSGVKYNILRSLASRGCRVTVVPPTTSAKAILDLQPDGLFLSNGPGDPEAVGYLIETVKKLIPKLPIFGICLGHQILGQALGGRTFKLKFGHHGANHPVMDLDTKKVEITSQNHNYCVDVESMPQRSVRMTHVNLNDNTCEGMEHLEYPVFSVQYHPEAAPGPHDSAYLFDKFISNMKKDQ
jgi:carbamoyl-phosphate synthase small subunit